VLAVIVGTLMILLGVRVKIPPPEGRLLKAAEAPALFTLLKGLRKRLKTLRFHRVYLVTDFNAAVIQRPRLSFFGWWQNCLLIGLPLMETLQEEELRAVLAHEFAHLSKHDAQLSHWLYRLRKTWEQIFTRLQQPRRQGDLSIRAVSARFVRWFWPRFNAHAFVLSRQTEYRADRAAAGSTDSHAMISALARLAASRRFLDEKFWPEVRKLAAETPAPPDDFEACLRGALSGPLAAAEAQSNVAIELRSVTTNVDTHPCLNERLKALGWNGSPILRDEVRAGGSAADLLLAPSFELLCGEVNQLWQKQLASTWSNRNAKASILQQRLGDLGSLPAAKVDVDVLWDQAGMRMELEKPEVVEPLLRQIIALKPDHVDALIALGHSLLDRDIDEGREFLDRAMAGEEDCVPHACNLLQNYFRRTGQADAIREVAVRLDRHDKALAASREERNSVSHKDHLVPHGLDDAALDSLRAALAEFPEIQRVHLGRKEMKYFAKQKLFLLCIRLRRSRLGFVNRDREQAIVSKLALMAVLPGRTLVFAPRGSFSRLAAKVMQLPDSGIDAGLNGAR
jgi:Zn-dependent protease with chaperone function